MIVLFGSPQNFFGGYMETLLKQFVKHPATGSKLVRKGFSFYPVLHKDGLNIIVSMIIISLCIHHLIQALQVLIR